MHTIPSRINSDAKYDNAPPNMNTNSTVGEIGVGAESIETAKQIQNLPVTTSEGHLPHYLESDGVLNAANYLTTNLQSHC